jgi:hypothetical protein
MKPNNKPKESGYDPKNDLGAMVRFLNAVVDKTNTLIHQVDTQSNILISIGTAVFLFSANRYATDKYLYLLALSFFSSLSMVVGLFAVHPPRFMRKKSQKESMMYSKTITSYGNPSNYSKELSDIIGNRDKMIEQYSTELFNLCTYYYRPKRDLFKLSRNLLLTGIILGLLLFLADHI